MVLLAFIICDPLTIYRRAIQQSTVCAEAHHKVDRLFLLALRSPLFPAACTLPLYSCPIPPFPGEGGAGRPHLLHAVHVRPLNASPREDRALFPLEPFPMDTWPFLGCQKWLKNDLPTLCTSTLACSGQFVSPSLAIAFVLREGGQGGLPLDLGFEGK